LIDRYGDGSGSNSLVQPHELPVVMVVGAGRGPIVRAALQAAKRCGIAIRVFALDKNPNAVITLRNLIRTEGWEQTVTVVSGDMRLWMAPCQADIMVHSLRK
jgi:protein arginine N-methyltransferase 5